MEKSGAELVVVVVVVTEGETTTVRSTTWVRVPLVPVIPRVYVPTPAFAPASIVRVDVAVPPTGGVSGLGNVNVTSAGALPIHDAFSAT